MVESPSLVMFQRDVGVMIRLGGGLGSGRLMIGLDDLKGVFQHKYSYDSIIL